MERAFWRLTVARNKSGAAGDLATAPEAKFQKSLMTLWTNPTSEPMFGLPPRFIWPKHVVIFGNPKALHSPDLEAISSKPEGWRQIRVRWHRVCATHTRRCRARTRSAAPRFVNAAFDLPGLLEQRREVQRVASRRIADGVEHGVGVVRGTPLVLDGQAQWRDGAANRRQRHLRPHLAGRARDEP